jgi:hypothetical protein
MQYVTKFDLNRYSIKYLMRGITVILRNIKYEFRMRNESKVVTCIVMHSFWKYWIKLKLLLCVCFTILWDFDDKIKPYELINLKRKLGINFWWLQNNLICSILCVSWKLVKLMILLISLVKLHVVKYETPYLTDRQLQPTYTAQYTILVYEFRRSWIILNNYIRI